VPVRTDEGGCWRNSRLDQAEYCWHVWRGLTVWLKQLF